MRTVFAIAVVLMLAASLSACAGGDSGEEPLPTDTPATTPTPDNFDPSVLTALVVQPSEATGFTGQARVVWNPPATGVVSFSLFYGDDNFTLQTTVGRYQTADLFSAGFERIRTGLATLTDSEHNADIAGADQSFSYQLDTIPATYMLSGVGNFFVQTGFSARNPSRKSEVLDAVALQRYHEIAVQHVRQYLANPAAATPAAGLPTYPRPTATTPPTP